MKIAYVDMCGFRGYRSRVRIEFADGFTIIDGRNGVGKSTIFDAVEYALTGTLSKYQDAKASGESVADYLWWKGEGAVPSDHFVEVGFSYEQETVGVRRTQFGDTPATALEALTSRLCDLESAPEGSLAQLCATSIIRDEHIAGLSLDLKETDRYALLRDGLGANDSDDWISRAAQLAGLAKRKSQAAQQEVTLLNAEVASTARRIDDVRSGLVDESVIAEAAARLRAFCGSSASVDELSGPVRQKLAAVATEIGEIEEIRRSLASMMEKQALLKALEVRAAAIDTEIEVAADSDAESDSMPSSGSPNELAQRAKDLIALASLGRAIGLQAGHCPLCSAEKSPAEYADGVRAAEEIAKRLDVEAAEESRREMARLQAAQRLSELRADRARIAHDSSALASQLSDVNERIQRQAVEGLNDQQLVLRNIKLRESLELAQRDLRVLETISLNSSLVRARDEDARAKNRLGVAQQRAGQARRAESTAQALHDAARRAAAETLDRRLERVLPLMSELYRRLRPHPIWRDIEYSIRGDVRRFLKLQVGDGLNPQFIFSSGQRRAAGLAFLLSVNLSLAWNRWKSIMLDDPVQHVDDFRTVHLAELAAQLVSEGRQIICAVEDVALADLLCRRLPVASPVSASRVTLGNDAKGDIAIISETFLPMLPRRTLIKSDQLASAG